MVGVYFFAKNVPVGTYNYVWNNSSISIQITKNYLVFRDPEYTKHITIIDEGETLKFEYWAETYSLKIYKRKNDIETFWVVDDYFRGVSRSSNGKFQGFNCPDCGGVELSFGETIFGCQFENHKLIEIKKN
jgi:hypothetical protein